MGAVEGLLLLLLLPGRVAPLLGSSLHTLKFFKMGVSEPGPGMPQFIIVGYLDDQCILQYDSNTQQMLPQVPWIRKAEEEVPNFWYWKTYLSRNVEQFFRDNLWKRHNHTKGFHTWQWTHGCEMDQDGYKGGYNQFGYDGKDFLSLDIKTLTWTAADASAVVTKRKWEEEPAIALREKYYLEEECIEWLQKFLAYGKEVLLRTETPTGKVTRKKGYDGQETLFCQVYGFYPKEIEVTWMKDAEDQKQDTLTGGVVPNSDRTYHTWHSIEVDPEERDQYRCRVGHDSLLEPLDLAWEEPAPESRVVLWVGVVGVVVTLALIRAIFYTKKRRECSYQEAPPSDQGSESSGSASDQRSESSTGVCFPVGV